MTKTKYNRGITIIEALVSLVILTTAIIPALFMSGLANNVSASIRNNLIAANLAQEGIEIVRAIRDENWLNDREFDSDISDGDWLVEWDSHSLTAAGIKNYLKINENGIYNYALGRQTQFQRTIKISKISNSEIRVISEVAWTERGNDKKIQAESHLFDWK